MKIGGLSRSNCGYMMSNLDELSNFTLEINNWPCKLDVCDAGDYI